LVSPLGVIWFVSNLLERLIRQVFVVFLLCRSPVKSYIGSWMCTYWRYCSIL